MASSEIADPQAPPEELTGPTPRRVSASQDTVMGMIMFGFLILGFGGLTVWGSLDAYHHLQLRTGLRQSHKTTTGHVGRMVIGRHSRTVKYQFAVAGISYAGSAEGPPGADPNPSDPILIRYNPANPTMNHPDAWEWSPSSDLMPFLFSTFFFSMGGIGIVYLIRMRNLVRYGQPAVASVDSCAPNKKLYRVEYRFHTDSGGEQTGKSDSEKKVEVASTVWVLYMPDNPRRNCVYPNPYFDVW